MVKHIYSSVTAAGLHSWPDCDIESVSFLKLQHRHLFQIKAFKEVTHDDRDVEFIDLKNKITRFLDDAYYDPKYECLNFGSMSCEAIAVTLIKAFALNRCEVSEDGENGCVVVA